MSEFIYVNCDFCKENNYDVIVSIGGRNFVKCKNCGLMYWNPRKTQEQELLKYYEEEQPNEYYERLNSARGNIYLKHIKKIKKILNDKNSGLKLLDIGCSDGFFLEIAMGFGFEIYGVEISKKAISYANEKRPHIAKSIFEGVLKDAKFPNEYFDVILLWDVLDVLYSPNNELKEIYRILKKNGLLVFRVRNLQTHLFLYKLGKLLKNKIFYSSFVFNLYGFTGPILKKILQKNGFNNIKIYNSELTKGDPYLQSRVGVRILGLLKILFYYISQFLYFISFGKIYFSTAFIVYSRK